MSDDKIHMRPAEGPCETHEWSDEGMSRRLVDAMRERHGRGGITVCVECISRAKRIADVERGKAP